MRELREIGHDIRNALHSVSAGMGILSKANSDARLAQIIDLMAEGVNKMRVLIQELDRPAQATSASEE